MKRSILFASAMTATAGLFAIGASAQQQGTPTPDPQRLSIAQIATMMESQGYSVFEIELEHGRYDVEMRDSNGMKVEAYLDPTTGAVLPYHGNDDDYRRGWDDD